MYENGFGVSKDYDRALSWYRLAAKKGDADGQFFIGSMYYRGLGVPKDYAQAVKYFRLADRQGHAQAKIELKRLSK